MSDYTHLSDSRPVAAKPYRCRLCGLIIPTGETHLARRGVFEGAAFTDRMHLECNQATLDNGWTDEEWGYLDEQEFRRELIEWKKARAK